MSSGSGRRSWSWEQKQLIVEAASVPGASVAEVARQYDVNANLLFKWLRQAGRGRGVGRRVEPAVGGTPAVPMEFVPLGVFGRADGVAEAAAGPPMAPSSARPEARPGPPAPRREDRLGMIEIALPGGVSVRVDAFVNQGALRRVLRAVRDLR